MIFVNLALRLTPKEHFALKIVAVRTIMRLRRHNITLREVAGCSSEGLRSSIPISVGTPDTSWRRGSCSPICGNRSGGNYNRHNSTRHALACRSSSCRRTSRTAGIRGALRVGRRRQGGPRDSIPRDMTPRDMTPQDNGPDTDLDSRSRLLKSPISLLFRNLLKC